MKRGRSTGNPTAAQRARFDAIKDAGCIACRIHWGRDNVTAEIHHLTVGGRHGQKRRGHDFTIGLCHWHHRGEWYVGTAEQMEQLFGPSYAREPRKFREVFGDDDTLLDYQNSLIERSKAA